MKIVMTALVVGLLVSGCAAGPQIQQAVADISAATRADVETAFAIAAQANDPAGMACTSAILAAMPETAVALVTPQGVLSTFMLARETRRRIDAGVSDTIHNACAPLILDAETTLAKLGLMAVPGGGALKLFVK